MATPQWSERLTCQNKALRRASPAPRVDHDLPFPREHYSVPLPDFVMYLRYCHDGVLQAVRPWLLQGTLSATTARRSRTGTKSELEEYHEPPVVPLVLGHGGGYGFRRQFLLLTRIATPRPVFSVIIAGYTPVQTNWVKREYATGLERPLVYAGSCVPKPGLTVCQGQGRSSSRC